MSMIDLLFIWLALFCLLFIDWQRGKQIEILHERIEELEEDQPAKPSCGVHALMWKDGGWHWMHVEECE
jgi:hypothetical protein